MFLNKRPMAKRPAAAALAAALALAFAGCAAEPVSVDPAPYLTVEFSGMSGEGAASWSFDADGFAAAYGEQVENAAALAESCIGGSLEPAEGLSNGDTVTFHWELDAETARSEYNAALSAADAAFTVEGLDAWVTALDQIGQADWDAMAETGAQALQQREGNSLSAVDCLGGYLLVRNQEVETSVTTMNMVYIVYKAVAQLPDGTDYPYYAAVGFSDLLLHGADGSVEVTGDKEFVAYGNIDLTVNGGWYNLTGFETLEDLHQICAAQYEPLYSVESNVADAA